MSSGTAGSDSDRRGRRANDCASSVVLLIMSVARLQGGILLILGVGDKCLLVLVLVIVIDPISLWVRDGILDFG